MATVRDIAGLMEEWADSNTAEEWDNAGLITGDFNWVVSKILITLDVTPDVLSEAVKGKFNLIISHHPPVFKPLRKFTGSLSAEIITTAIKNDIAIYSSHTNLDRAKSGVSFVLAKKLGLENISVLVPEKKNLFKFVTFCPSEYTDKIREAAGKAGAGIIGDYSLCSFSSKGTGTFIPSDEASPFSGRKGEFSRADEDRIEMIVPSKTLGRVIEEARKAHPYQEMAYDIIPLANSDRSSGYGAVGKLGEPVAREEFAKFVAKNLGIENVAFSAEGSQKISRVAVMGGSGSKFITNAINAGSDAFVTGEIGYHDFLEYSGRINLFDAGHRGTELPIIPKIADVIRSSEYGDVLEIMEFKLNNQIPAVYCRK